VPAPDPVVPEAIDERAEEAAAAAEAANIGGPAPDYATGSEPGTPAPEQDEAERPLAEAGEGESEGAEQADADLTTAAEPKEDKPGEGEWRTWSGRSINP
jgi:hypothetical protein